ncbi:MAG: EfeM/EfeO family lipoprotein [Anaerolineae bacterium]|nr:EfeM/EfeO family lipoprotein [Anaerolineae bacterium]
MNRKIVIFILFALLLPLGQVFAQDDALGVDATKTYLIEHGGTMLEHVTQIQADAAAYFDILEAADFDYEAAWDANQADLTQLVSDARDEFILAHNDYENIEGIVAGVPSLADFDVWIDAGPLGAEDPESAYDWTLTLDDRRSFEKPGNIFHWLLETTLWGTQPDHSGARVDFDDNGADERGDALPDAHYFLAIANAFVDATTQLNESIAAWEPTLEDSFTALATMIPTMGDYFQEWKNSTFVAGDDPRFVAQSRLVDVKGIATSLSVIYGNVGADVTGQDATLNDQIDAGFTDLLAFLDETYAEEQSGKEFSAEQADALGEQAQSKADSLAALVGQAASLLNLTLPNLE